MNHYLTFGLTLISSILPPYVLADDSTPAEELDTSVVEYTLTNIDQDIDGNKVTIPIWLTPSSKAELFQTTIETESQIVLVAKKTALQWGGPETRVRCINELKTKGLPSCHFEGIRLYCKDTWIKACTEWATDLKQHSYDIYMYGPPDLNPNQLNQIKDSCNISAITSQLFAMPLAADTIVSLFTDSRPIMESTMRTCLATTAGLSQIYVKGFKLELVKKDFW